MTLSEQYRNYRYTAEDHKILEQYKTFVDAIGQLLGRTCEVVLHSFEDLNASVIYIHNGELTGRTVGSPVTDKALQILQDYERSGQVKSDVYFTRNRMDHRMRSTSTIITNDSGQPIGMLCMNLDLSVPLELLCELLVPQVVREEQQSAETFATHADEIIVSQTCKAKEQVYADSSIPIRSKVKKIVEILNEQGVFKLREAVIKVAQTLDVSKDVVYLHLRQLKKQDKDQ